MKGLTNCSSSSSISEAENAAHPNNVVNNFNCKYYHRVTSDRYLYLSIIYGKDSSSLAIN